MNIKSGLKKVFSANLIQVISMILVGFFVPAILTVDDYAILKTYTFYIGYIGLLHFGFVDGMYIRYGGKRLAEIESKQIIAEHNIFWIFQILITIFLIVGSYILKDYMFFLIAISVIPFNILTFYKRLTQSTGEFTKYAKLMTIYNFTYLILNLIFVFILRSEDFKLYIYSLIISNMIVVIIAEIHLKKILTYEKPNYSQLFKKNISIGFFILIGNITVNLFYAIDRWFVKIFLDNKAFAYYSFAVSMNNIILVLINAISITFYNFLAKDISEEKIQNIKNHLLILSGGFISGYFILHFVVTIFLKDYIQSLRVISISFASFPFYIVINAIYLNLYKSKLGEKKYLKVVLVMLLISTVFNSIGILFNSIAVVALSTTLAFITWYFYSLKDFPFLKPNKNELLYLISLTLVFLTMSNFANPYIGFVVYIVIYLIAIRQFFISEFEMYIKKIKFALKP